MGDKNKDTPTPPDYAKLYQQGIDILLKNNPRLLDAELEARRTYDPQRIADQQGLQEQFGPTMYAQQLAALNQLDPNYAATRESLRSHVMSDLEQGTNLTPEQEKQFESQYRGAQAARGNTLGNAAALGEAYGKTAFGQQMYQQRLAGVGSWLAGATPEQQLLSVQGVQPDRSMAYVNPSAGAAGTSFGLQNYQNLLAGQQLQQQNNPWTSAISGAATGAAAGSAAGPWGALIGGVVGGAGGYFGGQYSDTRLKEDMREIGKTKGGIPLIRFKFIGKPKMFIGVRAQDVQKVRPDAVIVDKSGFLKVLYDKLDVPYLELGAN